MHTLPAAPAPSRRIAPAAVAVPAAPATKLITGIIAIVLKKNSAAIT